MKRAVLISAILLVVGGIAYLLTTPEPTVVTETIERRADGTEAEARDPITLRGRGEPANTEAPEPESEPPEVRGKPDEVGEPEAPPTRRLDGLVTDVHDVPVADVRFQLESSDVWAVSDYDGTFSFPDFPVRRANLEVQPGGDWIPVSPISVGPDQAYARVRLRRGTSMRILVLGADGAPAGGARFWVASLWSSEDSESPIGRHPPGHTDDEGVYVARGLPPGGLLELHVGGDEWPDVRFRDVPIDRDELVLRLPLPVVLEGVLVDENGNPLCGIGMTADGCEPHVWHMNLKTTTDATTGRFRFDMLAPGRYRLDVAAPAGYADQHEHRFVHAPRFGLQVELARLVSASGTVLGTEPSNVTVHWCAGGRRGSREPAEDGSFTFERLPNFPGTLYACHDVTGDAFLLEGVRPGDGPFTIPLVPALTIRGTVPGFSSTRHAPILIGADRGPLTIEGTLHADDTFEISGVPPGLWTIQLWEDGGCVQVEDVEAGTQDVVVRLPAPSESKSR